MSKIANHHRLERGRRISNPRSSQITRTLAASLLHSQAQSPPSVRLYLSLPSRARISAANNLPPPSPQQAGPTKYNEAERKRKYIILLKKTPFFPFAPPSHALLLTRSGFLNAHLRLASGFRTKWCLTALTLTLHCLQPILYH